MNSVLRCSLLGLVLLIAADRALAGPIVDHADINGLRTFKDEGTGLIWADLDNFFDQSFNEMKSAVEAAGFTVAEKSVVEELLNSLPLDGTGTLWDGHAAIMGRAPNRDLIWGGYAPVIPGELAWAFSFRGNSFWSFDDDTGFDLDNVPNGGSNVADMNIWAFRETGVIPEPSTLVLGLTGLVMAGGAAWRHRRRT